MADKSKAEAVREYVADNPDATPKDIVEALGSQGFEVNARYVSSIKSRAGKGKKVKSAAKAAAKKSTASKKESKAAAKRGRASRPYPAKTLEEALAIPKAIREQNHGNPWDTEDVAQAALGVSKSNNKFFIPLPRHVITA